MNDEALTRQEIDENRRPLFTPFISIETTVRQGRTIQNDGANEEEKTIPEEDNYQNENVFS